MSRIWKAGRFELELTQGKPLIMGIVNVTPDSFSDGGKFFHTLKAIDHARQLLEAGANILDVGGESTRPGAAGVDVDEEWARVSDVLRELISWNVPVSIDTMKATVMARAVDLGVDILNDVNGFRDEGAEQVLTQSAAGAVVMHMNGEPRTMQNSPEYGNVVSDVEAFLNKRLVALEQLGVPLIVSHMFVFYFGILADLTPPVALACFAAAPIAKERGLTISMEAVKIAAAGFVIPFMAVYTPSLMLQDGGPLASEIGYIPAVIYIVIKTLLAISLWGAAVIGYLGAKLPVWLRVLAMGASFTLIAALPVTDEIGFALAVVFGFLAWRNARAMKGKLQTA